MGRSGSAESSNSRSRSSERGRKPGRKDKKAKKDKRKHNSDSARTDSEGRGRGSSSALALPENVRTVDAELINSLCRSVNAMTTAMTKVTAGMDKVQAELRSQKAQVQAVVSQMEKIAATTAERMTKFEHDMASINADIDTRLAKLNEKTASPPTYAATASSASAAASSASSKAPVADDSRLNLRPTRLWLKGFGETLTTKHLMDYTNKAIQRLPEQHRSGAKPGSPGFGAVAFIDFPPEAPIKVIKATMNDMKLQHTDGDGNIKDIRITNDIPLPVRYKSKVLGELWHCVKAHILNLPKKDQPDPLQLSNNNGKLYMIHGPRPIELFATKIDGEGNMQVKANDTNLNKYRITPLIFEAWISDAITSAARFAGR
jgi:hypothetical protein